MVILLFFGCSTRRAKIGHTSKNQSHTQSSTKKSHHSLKSYTVRGKKYYPTAVKKGTVFHGNSSWYGSKFHGRLTASGEKYNMYKMTAAHKTLPMQTMLKVTNKANGKSVVVRVNDRGPFIKNRIIDVSKAAAQKLKMTGSGVIKVKIEVLSSSKDASNAYIVKKGDTLGLIAKRHNVSVASIKKRNHKTDSLILIGEKLKIYD